MSTTKEAGFVNPDGYAAKPEVWGGIECSITRIGDVFYDQLEAGGHYARHTDFGQLSELGIKSLRFPILWEKHQCNEFSTIDWSWTSRQLMSIRSHGITPIAGLLHHGSGPLFTDLLAPDFSDRFSAYAGQVAARFPWLEWYTPVNEPLTTSRFSGLYGLWYPHGKDAAICIRMLLNQVRATIKAMEAIRKVNPAAKLIQTEDLACIHSTPALAYQATFENHRRWLTFDLLCGSVNRAHALWDYLAFIGVRPEELSFFSDNPCIPDILGLNYYMTSERFLDENLTNHPASTHGGNGREDYADTEAVRVIPPAGLSVLLHETWDRYRLPIAVTEAHLHCTREEQVRWLKEVWDCACRAKQDGVNIRAVTAWSLCGAYDWDSLLTKFRGHYEQGACLPGEEDCQLTATGFAWRDIALTGDCSHPLLSVPGWWHRDHGYYPDSSGYLLIVYYSHLDRSRQALCRLLTECSSRGLRYRLSSLYPDRQVEDAHPWAVIAFGVTDAQRNICRDGSSLLEIPFLFVPLKDELDYRDLLDCLIDESFAMSSIAATQAFTPVSCL